MARRNSRALFSASGRLMTISSIAAIASCERAMRADAVEWRNYR